MTVLELQGVACEKQDRLLFSDLNFSISSAQLCALTGENGAGKTSLLRIICGLSEPSEGRVIYQNQPIAERQSPILYVGHKPGTSPVLSPIQNLTYWSQQQGIDVSTDTLIDLLDTLKLTGLEELPCKYLSAGQQRRVALARLWLQKNAKLWVLDEPFTALDVDTVNQLCAHIDSFVESGGSVIFTSHQQAQFKSAIVPLHLEYQW